MTKLKFLFLDVDDVLNPHRAKNNLHGDWRKEPIDRYRFWVSKNLGGWLNDLVESGVRIVWATSWVKYPEELREYAQHMGIPNFSDRIDDDFDPLTEDTYSGKKGPIERWMRGNKVLPESSRLVWIDDEICRAERLWMEGLGGKVVIPNPASGLANFKLRAEIEDFYHE